MLQRNKRDVTKASGNYSSITSTTSEKGGEKVAEEVKILYAKTPITVQQNTNMQVASAALLGEIIALSHKTGYAYASNSHYAERLGVSKRSIISYMNELDDFGYIRRVHTAQGKNNTLRVIYVNFKKLEEETAQLRCERQNTNEQEIDVEELFVEKNLPSETSSLPSEESAPPSEKSAQGSEKDDTGGVKNLLGGSEEVAPKDSIHYSINHSIYESIKESIKDDDSDRKPEISDSSQQVEKPSSKDNRPNGLSAPSVADVPIKIPINESVVSKEPKSNYDFSFSTIQYLASRESSSYKKTASLYPNKDNINDAVRYFAKVASVELNIPELREEIKNLPATESREFLEYLEFKVKQKRAIPIS